MKKIICLILVIIAAVTGGVFVYLHMDKQIDVLNREAETIKKMDIKNDKIDMKLYCTGDYMAVEDTMKEYINSYLGEIDKFEAVMNDTRLSDLLAIDNIASDNPEFINSRELLNEKKQELEDEAQILTDMAKEENIIAAIDEESINDFQKRIYDDVMLERIGTNFFYPESEITKAKEEKLSKLDDMMSVFDFLQLNLGNWSIDNNILRFTNDQLLNEYRDLISRID
ncbi:MAG: hypothetical protein MR372_00185 [Lachnospiraceae bacterium]|nr:hypothetical protein [Lachnospiraceae bacterium]MDY6222260.1 hypothetical protein [Candidatus Alectryocaccobium sp.]